MIENVHRSEAPHSRLTRLCGAMTDTLGGDN